MLFQKRFASQFTIYMTTGATGSIAGAALIGPIKENFSWEISFLFFVGFMLLAWLVMQFLNIDTFREGYRFTYERRQNLLMRVPSLSKHGNSEKKDNRNLKKVLGAKAVVQPKRKDCCPLTRPILWAETFKIL